MAQARPIFVLLVSLAGTCGGANAAHADVEGECASQQCPAGSPHEYEVISCDTPGCYCWDSCGGSSGSSSTAGGGNLLVGLTLLLAKGIYYTVGLTVFPVVLIEIGMSPDQVAASRAAAAKAWRDHRAAIAALEASGREASGMDAKLAATEHFMVSREEHPERALSESFDWGADDLRDAPGDRKAKPRQLLVPTDDFMCGRARIEITYHVAGPIAGFPDEETMAARCGNEKPARDFENDPDLLDCHRPKLDGQTPARCPRGYPIFNPCGEQCFRNTDFLGGNKQSRHCTQSVDCAVSAP